MAGADTASLRFCFSLRFLERWMTRATTMAIFTTVTTTAMMIPSVVALTEAVDVPTVPASMEAAANGAAEKIKNQLYASAICIFLLI